MKRSYKISLFIGNILDHFDRSLYGLLVPFLAPLFFPEASILSACSALFLPIGFLARPLGALFLGWIGDHISQEKALWISLQGVCITTALMGFLPTNSQIGPLSYVLLVLLRALLSFFSAGEAIGAFLVLIKDPHAKKKSLWASLFETSNIVGTFLAMFSIALLSTYHQVEMLWRGLFMLSGCFCIFNAWLRRKTPQLTLAYFDKPKKLVQSLFENKKVIFLLSILGGFSYVNYEVVIALMNLYYSLKGVHSYEEMLWMSTLLILLDMVLLPLFGLIAEKIGKYPLMIGALLCYLLLAPLWAFILEKPTLVEILLVRTFLVILGVAFCAPLKVQFLEMTKGESSYLLLALSKAIAAQCLGHPTIFVSLQLMNFKNLPSLFLVYPSLLALFSVVILMKERQKSVALKIPKYE